MRAWREIEAEAKEVTTEKWLCDYCGNCKRHCECDHYNDQGECPECLEDEIES
jgi:hypothetical protein